MEGSSTILLPESNPNDNTNDEINKEDVNGNESLWVDIVPVVDDDDGVEVEVVCCCCCFIGRNVAVLIKLSSSHSKEATEEKLLNRMKMANSAMYPTTLAPLSH